MIAPSPLRFSGLLLSLVVLCLAGCQGAVPKKYVRQAEHGVTLTALKQQPEVYRGKVVILGGVIVDKKEEHGRVWLWIKNRPLDEDFVPHVPASLDGHEAGFYWVALTPQGLAKSYHSWARITVVGQISEESHPTVAGTVGSDTVLVGLYLRGWSGSWGGYGTREDVWEDNSDANAIMSAPKTILRTGQGQ
jgi:starvation-inducible outer membrane lipoprotein